MPQEQRIVRGYALVVGDDIDTDTIIPARYLHRADPQYLAEHVFEDAADVRARMDKLQRPIIIVAGRGFGYGSSREHAVIALKAAGVAAILAESFHRIFYRNAINNALPVLEVKGLRGKVKDGDVIEVDLETGTVKVNGVEVARAKPLPEWIRSLLAEGGLRAKLRALARSSH